MLNLFVLYGGRSGEHDVSLCSAASVVSALDRSKYNVIAVGVTRDGRWHVQDEPVIIGHKDFGNILQLKETGEWKVNNFSHNGKLVLQDSRTGREVKGDIVFPAVHGTYCEDGTLQGLLELAMVPYIGADVLGSSIGMDKDVSKRLLRDSGIPVVPWTTITAYEWVSSRKACLDKIRNFGLPIFIKPANAGSSVGVKKTKSTDEIQHHIEFALQYDSKILVEKAVNAREIECAVLGNSQPEASILGEVVPNHEFYSYEAKYIDSNGANFNIPANLDNELSSAIRAAAIKAFTVLCCSGMARIDFFLEKEGGNFFLNEINTLPGFTSISMYPKLWEKSGLAYKDLLDKLIELALERAEMKNQLKKDI